jgi:hypothetical protein
MPAAAAAGMWQPAGGRLQLLGCLPRTAWSTT